MLDRLSDEMQVRYRGYETLVPQLADRLATQVEMEFGVCELGLTPPSSRADAKPYVEAVRKLGLIRKDISDFFSKAGPLGDSSNTFDDVYAGLTFAAAQLSSDFESTRRLLIVDDIFARGFTAGAIVKRLRQSGLRVDTEICIAVALAIGEW